MTWRRAYPSTDSAPELHDHSATASSLRRYGNPRTLAPDGRGARLF